MTKKIYSITYRDYRGKSNTELVSGKNHNDAEKRLKTSYEATFGITPIIIRKLTKRKRND